ncbi:MAG: alpha/beta hydrolase [Magnetococcales bacterium]|nr:alpha/beta hydrolase [Magnetococcales bacterium]
MATKFNGHFDLVGKGHPILCIPGFGNSNWVFNKLADRLQQHFTLVLPDNRGMGKSPPAFQPYLLQDLTQDCLNLMDDLGYENFSVIGLSMGGFVAQLLSLQASKRVKSLALLCATSSGEEFNKIFPSLSEEQVKGIYCLDAEQRIKAALSQAICPLLATQYPDAYQYVLEQRIKDQENPAQVMLQFYAVNKFLPNRISLENIICPTLVMTGDTDPLVPMPNAELLVKKIPKANLSVISDTDHLFFLEKEAEVAVKLSKFFSQF